LIQIIAAWVVQTLFLTPTHDTSSLRRSRFEALI
jgi:hypothetical protein